MKIKLLSEGAKMPTRADEQSAGYDLYVPKDTIIYPGRQVISLDLNMEITPGWEGNVRPRSGFSSKGMEAYKVDDNNNKIGDLIRIDADVLEGTVDASYRGIVGVIVNNHCSERYLIEKGTRIAQIVFEKCYQGPLEEVTELSSTERGEGGFGHSGSK